MSEFICNRRTRPSNTVRTHEGVSNLTVQISKLNAAEGRTRDIINHICSLLHDIFEPPSHDVNKKQKADEKRTEFTSSIITLNSICEQSRHGYPVLYTLWKQLGDFPGEDGNGEMAGQIRKLNQTHKRNKQGIVALWREVRDLHREEVKLTEEKGLVRGKAGKGGTSGIAWGHVLRVFSGVESDT